MKSFLSKNYFLSLIFFLCNYLQANQHIAQISIPKCGTHLLMKCIQLLTGKTSKDTVLTWKLSDHALQNVAASAVKLLWMHLTYDQQQARLLIKNNYIPFFIYRDPRDQIISYIFFYQKIYRVTVNMSDAITDLITKGSLYARPKQTRQANRQHLTQLTNHNIYQLYNRYLPWLDHPGMLSVRFEDLVGPDGGGSLEAQLYTIQAIADHLKLENCSDEKIMFVADELFGKGAPVSTISTTFRSGQIGEWKEYFTPEHKQLFKEIAGQMLIDLGYETDMNW